ITSANSAREENMPTVTDDEREMFFSRYGTDFERDIWVVARESASDPFGVPQKVVEASSSDDEFPSWVSPDSCRLYMISNRPIDGVTRYRVWVAEKPLAP